MLKKILIICALAMCGVISGQAMEQDISSNASEQNEKSQNILANEESEKDLTPGVLICNGEESKCLKDKDQEESPSSILFSTFCKDHEDEIQLLACKDCR